MGSSGDGHCILRLEQANRHGLIAGVTGIGKVVTLKVVMESFNDTGVPVFLVDVKGDLAGMCRPSEDSTDMQARITRFGLWEADFRYCTYPAEFQDIFGKQGFPFRMTVLESGLPLLARLLDFNKIQSNLLGTIFHITGEGGLLLSDIKDLKSIVRYVEESTGVYRKQCGNIGKSSTGAILRALVALEGKGSAQFFGEPALQISNWACVNAGGKGYANILNSTSLIRDPTICSTLILWVLSELFTELPEADGLEKPKMVLLFDEAYLLFDNAPKTLLDKIEQVVKLVRSKGIGVYFITQNPSDIPDGVLTQLGDKVQHAFRAYTPAEQEGIEAAAEPFRKNPAFDTTMTFQELEAAETLVSSLDEGGASEEVRIASILPPQSKFDVSDAATRQAAILMSSLRDKYAEEVDRESACEPLLQRVDEQAAVTAKVKEEAEVEKQAARGMAAAEKQAAKEAAAVERQAAKEAAATAKQAEKEAVVTMWEEKKKAAQQKRIFASIGGSVTGTIGREVDKQLGKSTGGSFGKQFGGNVGASLGRSILKTLLEF